MPHVHLAFLMHIASYKPRLFSSETALELSILSTRASLLLVRIAKYLLAFPYHGFYSS